MGIEQQYTAYGVPMNFDRNPTEIQLDLKNNIVGEVPVLLDRYTKIKIVYKYKKEGMLVKCSNDQAVLFVREGQVANLEMMKTSAQIIANSYTVSIITAKRKVHIGKVIKSGGDIEGEAENFIASMKTYDAIVRANQIPDSDPLKKIKSEIFAIDCHCNEIGHTGHQPQIW